jgi:septum formation protein
MSTGNDQHLNSYAGDETNMQFSSMLSSMKEKMNVENKKQCTLLWLGSGSQSRKQLLGELLEPLGVGFQTMSADIDEKAIRVPDPRELVVKLAHAKADAILRRMEDEGVEKQGFLLTCDQVVVHEDEILEKPETEEEARRFIDGYGRSPASTVGSVVCTNLENGKRVETVDVATVSV